MPSETSTGDFGHSWVGDEGKSAMQNRSMFRRCKKPPQSIRCWISPPDAPIRTAASNPVPLWLGFWEHSRALANLQWSSGCHCLQATEIVAILGQVYECFVLTWSLSWWIYSYHSSCKASLKPSCTNALELLWAVFLSRHTYVCVSRAWPSIWSWRPWLIKSEPCAQALLVPDWTSLNMSR